MGDNTSFAWRCWEITPRDLAPNEPWDDNNNRDPPRPPEKWRRHGFSRGWHRWRGAQLDDRHVIPRRIFSFAWCQRTQQYWVVPGDCTDRNAADYAEIYDSWEPLCCRHLEGIGKPGLWQLEDHWTTRQHNSHCPRNFDEFLPKNFFMGIVSEQPCHFVGHLSLILGLLAMCPDNVNNIPFQIDQLFYHRDNPRFISSKEYTNPQNAPRDKLGRLFFNLPSMTGN